MGPTLALLIATLLAGSPEQRPGAAPRAAASSGHTPQPARRQARATPAGGASAPRDGKEPARKPSRLEKARADLKALMADRQRRRYHHHWDRAIANLLAAAKGPEAPAATLEAARARYALYRWSAVEADRDEALRLATRASRLGARDAASFAAAIRREAGDDQPGARPSRSAVAAKGRPAAPAAPPPPSAEEPPADPQLEAVVAEVLAAARRSSPAGDAPGPAAAAETASPSAAETATPAGEPRPAEPPAGAPDRVAGERPTGPATGGEVGPVAEESAEPRPVRRVVVDAGHGGYDPGAVGPTRVKEKDVTLAIATRLATRLEKAGFEVVLTRRDDRYVPLADRTSLANARRGDLFISIHCNANPQRALTGTETWILNVADDRYAKRLEARENGALLEEAGEGSEAQRILTDLDAKASTEASRRLAQVVQREVTGAVRTRYGDDRDLGVKSALFHVLVGARMPAVLVETAFISNRREEQRLASPAYQDLVAGALARAVQEFAHRDPRVARAEPVR